MIIHEIPSVMTCYYTQKTKNASGLNAASI